MTKQSPRNESRLIPLRGASQVTAALSNSEYARRVGNRVTELIEHALEEAPNSVRTDPDSMAKVITDLVTDRVADPGRSALADMVAPLWTAEHTRRVLNLSRATMSDRRKTGSLLALKSGDAKFFYPVSQFEKRDGKVQVKPALREFMMALRHRDPWTTAVLIHTPASELSELTPLDWVRKRNDPQTLVSYAHVLCAEYGR